MPSRRLPRLDVLRGLAVLLVLGNHLPGFVPGWPVVDFWHKIGWTGVDLFFVLSGFLVSGLLFAEFRQTGRVDVPLFIIRRGFKIYPPFYFLLLATPFIKDFIGLKPIGPLHYLTEALFFQNYFVDISNIYFHTWTLGVEEQFYLFIAAAFFLMTARNVKEPFRAVPWIFLGLALFCLTARLWIYQTLFVMTFQTFLRVDSLFFGVFLSWAYHFRRETWDGVVSKWRVVIALAAAALLAIVYTHVRVTAVQAAVDLTLLYLGFGLILALSMSASRNVSVISSAVAWLGVRSYSIYLWHVPCAMVAERHLGALPRPIVWPLYVAASLLLGVGMAHLIEFPFLALRDRFFPSRSKTADSEILAS